MPWSPDKCLRWLKIHSMTGRYSEARGLEVLVHIGHAAERGALLINTPIVWSSEWQNVALNRAALRAIAGY
jgi:hypothetical protein